MALTRKALTVGVFQSAVYDTVKGSVWFLFGLASAWLTPRFQEVTGMTLLASLGWVLFGCIAIGLGSALAYNGYVKPCRLQARSDDLPLTGKVFVWRTEILGHDFTSDRPFVDFALDLFNGSLLPITIKARAAGGYVHFGGKPLPQRLEVLQDVAVESGGHGRLMARQWLAREQVSRQAKWLTSPESESLDGMLKFSGLPIGPSFTFTFSETRIPVQAGEKEYPL